MTPFVNTNSPYVFPGVEKRHKHQQLINALMGYVCEIYKITIGVMKGKSRRGEVVEARYVCMYMLRTFTNLTLDLIGESFERDHATVLYGQKQITKRLADSIPKNAYLCNYIKELEKKFIVSKYLIK